MKRTMLAGAFGMVLLVGCSAGQVAEPPPLPVPDIDQPIRQLEEHLAQLEQQQPMNRTSANLAFLYDAKLYMACQQRMASMTTAQRWRFCEEQQKWSDDRRRASAEAYAEFEGGTLASLSSSRKWIELTKARLVELQRAWNGM